MKTTSLLMGALLAGLYADPARAQDYRRDARDRQEWREFQEWRAARDRRDWRYDAPEVRRANPSDYRDARVAPSADPRRVWAYTLVGGGRWEFQGNGKWVQYTNLRPYNYRETARTPDYVEMHDDERGIWVRLYPDRYLDRGDTDPEWHPQMVNDGRWVQ